MSKSAGIVALVGLNLLLLTAVILQVSAPKPAYAQAFSGNRFVAATVAVSSSQDALCIVELSTRQMLVLRPDRQGQGGLALVDRIDLGRDFGGEAANAGGAARDRGERPARR